ncbi:MAG TPA: EamA family transporter [Candidatus Limnocylindrales bacterium]|nr:EamA family transporter [Candidatus Limnocylindrales bacterium]
MIAAVARVLPVRGSRRASATSPLVWLALGTVYLLWGSTYLGIRLSLDGIPPLLMGSARFLLAGGLLAAWTIARGDWKTEPITGAQWLAAAGVGVALLLGGNGGVILGEQFVPSGVAALCVATAPMWMAIIDRVVFGQRLHRLGILGLIVGFGGVVLLVGLPGGEHLDWRGIALCLAAPICWASGSVFSRHVPLPRRPLIGSAIEMLSAGSLFLLLSLLTAEPGRVHPATIPPHALAAVLYLVVFGSIVGFSAYAWLLRNAPLPLVSTYAYVNPVVAVILGALVLREAVGGRTLLAGGVIVAGVILILTSRLIPQARPAAHARS